MDQMFYHVDGQDDVMNMIQELEQGNEPILLKLVSNTATQEEKDKWASENNISPDEINNVLSILETSFKTGSDLAKTIESDILSQNEEIKHLANQVTNQNNNRDDTEKEKILDKLNTILEMLDDIKIQVDDLARSIIN